MKVVTKESIRELPLIEFSGEIVVVDSNEKMVSACQELAAEKTLGFDTEKRPAFRRGEYFHPALVQLATEKKAFLFQVQKTGFSAPLKTILEDTSILKLGVALRDDLKELNRMSRFSPSGFVELADMAKEKDIPYFGLRNLTAFFLDRRLSKGQQVSNWENDVLSPQQQTYAATDAWVALRIYEGLDSW